MTSKGQIPSDLEASKILEAVLQQMDGIILGKYSLLYMLNQSISQSVKQLDLWNVHRYANDRTYSSFAEPIERVS